MKNNLKRLAAIMGMFPENAFYSNTITEYDVALQGKLDTKTIKKAQELKFQNTGIDKEGYVLFTRGDIRITLT